MIVQLRPSMLAIAIVLTLLTALVAADINSEQR